MDGLLKSTKQKEVEEEFSFKKLFVPFTTLKAIHWIIIIGLIVYFNGLFNGFVLDDIYQIVNNTYTHSFTNIVTFFTGSTFYNGGTTSLAGAYYKPLLTTYFAAIYTLFGANPFAFHFLQLVLHIVNACLVLLLFKKFFKLSLSFVLSLIFLVHPINSEAVFYIADAQDILFFFFGVIALYLITIAKSQKAFLFITIFLALSLLSKETGLLSIIISIIYAYLYKRKYFIPLLISSFAIFAGYLLLRVSAMGLYTKAASGAIDRHTLTERLINIPAMFLFYIKQFVFPLNLSVSYQWAYKQITVTTFYLPLLIDILFIALTISIAIILKRKNSMFFKSYLFFFCWFFSSILFHMQFFPLDATVAERWFYFPIVGLLGMIGVVLTVLPTKPQKAIIVILTVFLILLLGVRTFIRSFDWRNEFTLVSHDVMVSHNDYYLEDAVSIDLARQGRYKEAKAYIEQSVHDFPFYTNINTLGIIYTHEGNYTKAKEAYLQALRYGNFYFTYENLGGLTIVSGKPKENIALLTNILKKYPYDDKLWLYLAIVEYRQKNIDDAKTAISNAYQINPSDTNAYYLYKMTKKQPINVNINTTPGS